MALYFYTGDSINALYPGERPASWRRIRLGVVDELWKFDRLYDQVGFYG